MEARATAQDSSRGRMVGVANPAGAGDFVLVCEHASNFIPAELNDLGLSGDVLRSHIAWDPGALAVAQVMAVQLDAPLVAQRVSRLVYDCNRDFDVESAIPARSEIHDIPGNTGISAADREARAARYYAPFRDALNDCIEQRIDARQSPALVTVHSFAPVFAGHRRDLDIGILHDTDARFADAMIAAAEATGGYSVRRNAPYGPRDGVMHTLKAHALPRGLLNVMLEIRHDLIEDSSSQKAMAEWLSHCTAEALAALTYTSERPEPLAHGKGTRH